MFNRPLVVKNAPVFRHKDVPLPSRRTKLVLDAIHALAATGASAFAPADVGDHLRGAQTPMLMWEIRGELSKLEASGDIEIDSATARWSLRNPTQAKSDAV